MVACALQPSPWEHFLEQRTLEVRSQLLKKQRHLFLVTTTDFLTTFQLFLDLQVLFAFKFPIRFFLPENTSFHRKKQTAQDRAPSGPLSPLYLCNGTLFFEQMSHIYPHFTALYLFILLLMFQVSGNRSLGKGKHSTHFPPKKDFALPLPLSSAENTKFYIHFTGSFSPSPTLNTLLKSRGMS